LGVFVRSSPFRLLVLSILLSIPLFALSSEFNSLQKGDQALQYGLNYDFTLQGFKGTAISYQVFPWSNWALRGGFSLSVTNYDIEERAQISDGPYWYGEGSANLEEWYRSFTGRVQLVYFTQGKPISVFLGIGPHLEFRRRRDDRITFRSDGYELYQTRTATETKSTKIGAELSVGIQYPIASRFTVHVEYGGKLLHESSESAEQYWHELEFESSYLRFDETRAWDFFTSPVLVGLSVYF
jgi:opacity protein-like surface antigen